MQGQKEWLEPHGGPGGTSAAIGIYAYMGVEAWLII
jgi:hypothetical protein